MSPFRGSDAGGDVGTSVSTLPLISEAAYDDEQQLMQEVDELAGGEGVSGRVSGFDEAEEDQIEDGFAAQTHAAAQGAIVMNGISGRPRVSSSHGSITSAASDASLSAPGSVASGAAAIGTRMPSPAGVSSSSFGRPVYGSQRTSGSRHSLHSQQQVAGSDSRVSTDLPPFGMRKRPDDDTCSYATQAGEGRQAAKQLNAMLQCCRAMLDWLGVLIIMGVLALQIHLIAVSLGCSDLLCLCMPGIHCISYTSTSCCCRFCRFCAQRIIHPQQHLC
jgi:hypothetical protein